MHKLTRNLYLSRLSENRAKEACSEWTCTVHYISIKDSEAHQSDCIFISMHSFCHHVEAIVENVTSEAKIVVCPTRCDGRAFAESCLYMGSYLILKGAMKYEEVLNSFQNINQPIEERTSKCWQVIHRAVQHEWLANLGSDIEPVFDADEFAHYASPAQGRVYLALPGAMHFFPTPDDLLGDQEWADYVEDGRTVRLFSAHFYADLFAELKLSVVLCLGRSSAATAAAFAARGIETVDLELAADGSSLLRGLDRLLSLAREAPGAVAVHSGDGFEWPAYAGTLSAAFMISRFGLEEGAAKAWLGMVVPWMVADVGETTLVRP